MKKKNELSEIDEFSRRLVKKYGARESFYMAHTQVIFKKK
jgi:hypothetical protein